MSNATPLPLYAIGLGSNRRHARYGDPRAVLLAALAAQYVIDGLRGSFSL